MSYRPNLPVALWYTATKMPKSWVYISRQSSDTLMLRMFTAGPLMDWHVLR